MSKGTVVCVQNGLDVPQRISVCAARPISQVTWVRGSLYFAMTWDSMWFTGSLYLVVVFFDCLWMSSYQHHKFTSTTLGPVSFEKILI